MNIRHITLAASFAVLLSACGGDSAVTEMPPPAANTVCTGTEATSSRLFLQQLSDTSVIVKWRGDATAACIGTCTGSGGGCGEMDFSFRVDDEQTALKTIDAAMQTHMPGAEYRIRVTE